MQDFYHLNNLLKFTPLEFETLRKRKQTRKEARVKIYSVGVWNFESLKEAGRIKELKFTPLEFETMLAIT